MGERIDVAKLLQELALERKRDSGQGVYKGVTTPLQGGEGGFTCPRCKAIKPISSFRSGKSRTGYCAECRKSYATEMYALKNKSNVGNCPICGEPSKLVLDHNHDIGLERGYVCRRCNTGLGMFKYSIKALQGAIEYLNKYTS